MAIYAAFDVFPRAKGSSSHIASMVQGLARQFGSVRLLCLGTAQMPARQVEGTIEILRYREPLVGLATRATGFANFVRENANGSQELMVFRDPWGGYPLLDALPGVPAIFEVNALPSWELPYSYPGVAASPALVAKIGDLERKCLRDAAGVLCVSSVTARALAAMGVDPRRTEVIPNVAHDVFFSPPDLPSPLPEGRWFGYLGGLQPWQGVETALEGFALVAADLPNLGFAIVHGDNAAGLAAIHRRIARLRLGSRVTVFGPLETPQVAALLPRLEFTVVPLAPTPRNTRQGCCPVKMVESMAAGTAVIASGLAVCREWIRHRETGWLAEPGDPRSWARAIHTLAVDEAFRKTVAAGARVLARERFSWNAVHARLGCVFDEVSRGKFCNGSTGENAGKPAAGNGCGHQGTDAHRQFRREAPVEDPG